MQKSKDQESDAAPQCSLVGRWLPFLAKHDDRADRYVVLAARCPPDVRFHHEAVKRQHFFFRESMHLLPLVTVLVLDTVRWGQAGGTGAPTPHWCAYGNEP